MDDSTTPTRRPIVTDGSGEDRCDFCRSRIPLEPKTLTVDSVEYSFCTEACREALRARERVFTEYRGHRWFHPGVAALEAKLPQGVLRNSTVLLSARPGARDAEFQAELVWRTLNDGEPAVLVSFKEPPVSAIGQFLDLDWNVLPYLESGDLQILDCFTYRVEQHERMLDRMNDWNAHLREVAEPEITAVRDPTTPGEILNGLDACLAGKEMVDRGIVVVDSLTEFGSIVQPVKAYDLVRDLRAEVSKGRYVPVFAGATHVGDSNQFPHDLEYMFDGIVDMELNPKIVEDALIKRMRVRKMSGALAYPEWTAYEFTSTRGLVMFDPHANAGDGERQRAEGEDAGHADPDGGE